MNNETMNEEEVCARCGDEEIEQWKGKYIGICKQCFDKEIERI